MYKQERNYENLNRRRYTGTGDYDIPPILVDYEPVTQWIGFNYARTYTRSKRDIRMYGLHFFVDDYQFNRLWSKPDNYIDILRKFGAVCSPDFSTYVDYPKALQIYNHYRKHWLGAYWQDSKIRVIPTISWSDHSSYEWCFDGEPRGGTVAISSVGTQMNKLARQLFLDGYEEMIRRLHPASILLYGNAPADLKNEDKLVTIGAFQDKFL